MTAHYRLCSDGCGTRHLTEVVGFYYHCAACRQLREIRRSANAAKAYARMIAQKEMTK